MLVRRSSLGLTRLVSLLAVLAIAAPAAATVEKKGEWPAEDKKVTLSLDDIDQEDALEKLAEEAGWSIVIKGMRNEKATIHVKDQPAEKVLNVLLAEGDWIAQRDGNLISISKNPNPKPASEIAAPAAIAAPPPVPAVPPPPAIEIKADPKPEVKVNLAVNEDDSKGPRQGEGKDREVVGQNLIIDKDEVVRNVQLVGGSLVIKGTVTGDIDLVGGKLELEPGSRIMGDIQVMGGSVEVKNGARIDGDTQIVGGHLERQEGALVLGNVSTRIDEGEEQASMGARMAREIGECTTAGAFLFALGAVLIALFTKRSEMIKVEFAARPMRMFALGIAGFFGGLLTFGALCVTVVGIPFAAIGLLLAIIATFGAMTSVLEVVGRGLIGHKTKNEYAHLALGCSIFAVTMMIPVIDNVAKLVLMLVSIGSLVATRGAGLIPPRKNGQSMPDAHPYRSAEAV
jgi:cytoskeletal protein CcmA (bactofilin family)